MLSNMAEGSSVWSAMKRDKTVSATATKSASFPDYTSARKQRNARSCDTTRSLPDLLKRRADKLDTKVSSTLFKSTKSLHYEIF